MRQIEDMEQKEKAVKAGPCLTHLEGRVGHENEKVGEKRRVHDACNAGAGQQDRGFKVRKEGREMRSLKTRERKRPSTG